MIIKPKIRMNICTTVHPLGCEQAIKNQINEVEAMEKYEGPKNVLIIGGSSGYGLSSRISLAFGANANTINVSFESAPKGKRTGSPGWWNNLYFERLSAKTGNKHADFNGDAFSHEMKAKVIDYINKEFGKIDLVIYSLASGVRTNPDTKENVKSALKTIGEPFTGQTIDIATLTTKDITVDNATEQEIEDTIYVMGGDDWKMWIDALDQNNCLNQGVKTISYTYVGGKTTDVIYRLGSIGRAKRDLELKCALINDNLNAKYNGEALISSSKAVTTKASVHIPAMAIYMSCLYETMMKHGCHESIIEHKHRLFKDCVYGNVNLKDEKGRIRVDKEELSDLIQDEAIDLMYSLSLEEVLNLKGGKLFLKEYYQLNGFNVDGVDYNADIDLESLI
jgi:enoyl-[acyl-carrier protein] reductase/trans-2-enoyl-CoA reductase (NAD+)